MKSYPPSPNSEGEEEGTARALVQKNALLWGERLYPHGRASIASSAIQNYTKHFNQNPSPSCTNANWQCIGPIGSPPRNQPVNCSASNTGTGQVHRIRFSPNYLSDNTVYACSTNGGLWKSTDNGNNWAVTGTDIQLPLTSVSDIAIHPTNTDILFISTGESETTYGHHMTLHDGAPTAFTPLFTGGVYRSIDGGQNWQPINGVNEALLDMFPDGGVIRRIKLDPGNSNRLFITTNEGVFKTDNAMASNPTWLKVSGPMVDVELKGLEFKPNDPSVIYVSGRDVYRSLDHGLTWSSMTGAGTGLDLSSLPNNFIVQKINIAVTPAANSTDKVFAYIIGKETCSSSALVGRLYIYEYNGTTWIQRNSYTDRISMANCSVDGWNAIIPNRSSIAVSNNGIEIYYGTTKVRGNSAASPNSFGDKSPYLTPGQFHADVLDLVFEPGTNFLFAGTDGGVHKKDLNAVGNLGWTDLSSGIAVATTYRFDDSDDREDRILIGNQDCGTFRYTQNNGWEAILGGDGYLGRIDGKSGIGFIGNNTDVFQLPNSSLYYRYDFNTHTCKKDDLIPTDPATNSHSWRKSTIDVINHPRTENLLFPMTELYERLKTIPDLGDTPNDVWKVRSDIGKFVYPPDTDHPQWKRQLQVFDISESNPNYILITRSGWQADIVHSTVEPKLYLSTVGGCDGLTGPNGYNSISCFNDITQNLINSGVHNTYNPLTPGIQPMTIPVITGLRFHPEQHNTMWVTFTGYTPGIKVWKSTDGGTTWTNADPTGSLHNLPVNDIVYQKGSNDRLYIATDAGIYFKDNSMNDWERFCDFPNVRVTELKINYCMGKIRAATWGRSIWEGDLLPTDGTIGESELVIESGTVEWTASRGIDKNLRIKSGATLKITGPASNNRIDISIPKDGRITIEPGAKLIVTFANLTNNCGNTWKGIRVGGDPSKRQVPAFQGLLVLTSSRIEHAERAIETYEDNLFAGEGGGILRAKNTVFANNAQSAAVLLYENTNTSGSVINNTSYFENCTFTITNGFRFPLFYQHVSLWAVRGVQFIGCTFNYNASNSIPPFHAEHCTGIRSHDATAIIKARCLTNSFPCTDRCTFSGFNKGIYATGTTGGGYTLNVAESDFEDNVIGIETEALNNLYVRDCTFKVGKHGNIAGAPICHEGLILQNETGFTVDENVFEPSFTVNTPKTIGIRVLNSGGQSNKIYRNTFLKNSPNHTNIFYGNLANGTNRNQAAPDDGLQYLCNTNINNVLNGHDFAVEDGIGIAAKQGTLSGAAMNSFSLGTSVPGSDFTNSGNQLNYYAPAAPPNPGSMIPVNTLTPSSFIKYFSNPDGDCSPNFAASNLSMPQLTENYETNRVALQTKESLLSDKIDGIAPSTLHASILGVTSSSKDALVNQLNDLSPYLSSTTLKLVIEKTPILGNDAVGAILVQNPDAAVGSTWDYLIDLELLSEAELLALSEEIAGKTTVRSSEEDEIRQLKQSLYALSDQAIELLSDSTKSLELDSLIAWWERKPGIESQYEIVDLLLKQGKVIEARNLMNSIPVKYALTAEQAADFQQWSILKNMQLDWVDDNTDVRTLSANEVTILHQIAQSGKGIAAGQAKSLLNFAYNGNYFTPPVLPVTAQGRDLDDTNLPSEEETLNGLDLKAWPNPASSEVSFSCGNLGVHQKASLVIYAANGFVLKRIDILPKQTILWNTEDTPSGIYYYSVEAYGKALSPKSKLVILK